MYGFPIVIFNRNMEYSQPFTVFFRKFKISQFKPSYSISNTW